MIDFGLTLDISILYFLIGLSVLITLLAGYYPARILSGFHPIEALKQTISQKSTGFSGHFSLRKTLVVTQFVISQLLIIGTIIVALQMRYFHNRDLGFAQEGISITFIPNGKDTQKKEVFRNELKSQSGIQNVSFNSGPPTSGSNSWTNIRATSKNTDKFNIERKHTDLEYLSVYEINLLAGRNLRQEDKVAEDSTGYVKKYNAILNEKAIIALGYATPEEAIGEKIITDFSDGEGSEGTIIGVTHDFANAPLQEEIHPCMMVYSDQMHHIAAIKFNPEQEKALTAVIQQAWENLYPDNFFQLMLLDEYFEDNAFYVIEDIMYQGFKIFSFLAIFIGCLGLYGLVSYLSLQRQKEIGIRKVLGATVSEIIYLFSKEFTLLVLVAFFIAAPIGYFAMKSWLASFAHSIDIHWSYFMLALLASLCIALVTVGYKSVKAAVANPVESLKSE